METNIMESTWSLCGGRFGLEIICYKCDKSLNPPLKLVKFTFSTLLWQVLKATTKCHTAHCCSTPGYHICIIYSTCLDTIYQSTQTDPTTTLRYPLYTFEQISLQRFQVRTLMTHLLCGNNVSHQACNQAGRGRPPLPLYENQKKCPDFGIKRP